MYDYIITGAGSAGCVIADVLTAASDASVLLLEAGERDNSLYMRLPGALGKVLGNPRYNWRYRTVAQKHLNDRVLFIPQGKAVGGSSSINGMVYIRGNPLDYDHWRQLGNVGWGWDDVLPYFTMVEDNDTFSNEYHGTGGPLGVSRVVSPHPLSLRFVEAAIECGIAPNEDFNGVRQEGAGLFQHTIRRGVRSSAASAFLGRARRRRNLTIIPETTATRIVVENGRATGVEAVDRQGNRSRWHARQEVIVTSGAIGSPKLLMLSGIGPADELRQVGVQVTHDLPGVGKNFHDHPDIHSIFRCLKPITYDGQDAFFPALRHGLEYLLFRTGQVACSPCQAAAFVRSDPAVEAPDISLYFLPVGVLDHGNTRLDGHNITFHNNNMRPRSRGEIRLASADPAAAPLIDPNFLADPHDMKLMIECVRWARRIMQTRAMAPFAGEERLPGKDVRTDREIEAYVRQNTESDYHPVGACKMGNDDLAVVDDQLRVRGLEGLRVADSSIMPAIVSGNTNAPSIMIGRKAADLIVTGRHRRPAPAEQAGAAA